MKFLIPVSLSSKGTCKTPLPGNFATLICTITQEVELRFFRASKLSAAELGVQPWTRNHNLFKLLFCGRETECSGFLVVLNLRFQGRPAMCLSMASWVFGPGVCCLAPTQTPYSPIRDLQKSHTECFILMIVQNKCSVNRHFSKFVLSEVSSLRTLWFYHHLCHKLKKAENWQFMYYSMKLSLAAFR